jgi:hypothetical protein
MLGAGHRAIQIQSLEEGRHVVDAVELEGVAEDYLGVRVLGIDYLDGPVGLIDVA